MEKEYDKHWLRKCEIIKKNSTCLRRQVGSCIVNKDGDYMLYDSSNHSLLNKYSCKVNKNCSKGNSPSGTGHDICSAIHAEQSVLMQLLQNGICPVGMTLYVNYQPCTICARLICESGIKRVVYSNSYPDINSVQLMKAYGIQVLHIPLE